METRIKNIKGTAEQIEYLFELHGVRSFQRTTLGEEKDNTYSVLIRHAEDINIPTTTKTLTSLKKILEKFGHIEKDQVIVPEIFNAGDIVMLRHTNDNEFNIYFGDDKGEHRDLSWEYMKEPLKITNVQKGNFNQLSGYYVSHQDKPITGEDNEPFLFSSYDFVEYRKNAI